jgi:hypothetical protein
MMNAREPKTGFPWIKVLIVNIVCLIVTVGSITVGLPLTEGLESMLVIFVGVNAIAVLIYLVQKNWSENRQLKLAKLWYIGLGLCLGLFPAFFGFLFTAIIVIRLGGYSFWDGGFGLAILVLNFLVGPIVGARIMFEFGKRRRFLTPYYFPVQVSEIEREIEPSSLEAKQSSLEEAETIKNEAVRSISRGLENTKYEPMIKKLVNKYRNIGLLNPELRIENDIETKMANGKTREQAIEELYKKEFRK